MTTRSDSPAWSAWQLERLDGIENAIRGPTLLARPAFLDALNAAIREAVAGGQPTAAILLDLNNFAEINAAWGPFAGDELIAAAGLRIQAFAHDFARSGICGSPVVARLDGDHFVIIAPAFAALEVLKREIANLIRELAQPFSVAGQSVGLSARAAIVQIPAHARSVGTALGRGFRLLNTAARVAVDGVAVSRVEASQNAATVMLERDLAAALGTDQLFIALQPKVLVTTGAIVGAEALARWQHPERGMLPPSVFVDAAERSGLIFDLGLRVLRDVCRASNDLAASGRELSIAVNVSPHQLGHPEFLSRFLEIIDHEGIKPQTLEIEVTETAAMMGGERVNDSLQALRRCGIKVALDDFGTGFSNLASLAALPADTLKIDRSLVTAGGDGGRAGALLAIAVQIGRTFGMETVAEGVETSQQMQRVTELGCDLVQGYFTGRPVAAPEFAGSYLPD